MPLSLGQAWYILQANAQTSSSIIQGPIFDENQALASCETFANKNPGVGFIVVLTVAGFSTDQPKALPVVLTSQTGAPLLEATAVPLGGLTLNPSI